MDGAAAKRVECENEVLTSMKYWNWQKSENVELATSYHDSGDDDEYTDLMNAQKRHMFES